MLNKIKAPNSAQQLILRRLILSAYPDQVARLVPRGEQLAKRSGVNAATRNAAALFSASPAYQTCTSDDWVYIHPRSFVFQLNPPPQWIVYTDVKKKKKKKKKRKES